MRIKVVWTVAAMLLLSFMIVACGTDNPVIVQPETESDYVSAAPSSFAWHYLYTDHGRNQKILDEASAWDGMNGGQCKAWVQAKVVWNASGQNVWLPSNFTGGGTYNLAKWNSSSDVQKIWQGANYSPAYFPNTLKPGQIIQLRWSSGARPSHLIGQPHTAIIKSVSSTSMEWWDSNFVDANTVGDHSFTLSQWSRAVEAWTVYQVK